MLADPNFAAGAMENWGLILYKESRMLVKTENPTYSDRESAATVIAHELVHMVICSPF